MRASCGHRGVPVVIGASGEPCCSRCDAPLVSTGGGGRHTQHDDARPCKGRKKYLRTWKRGRAAGDPEVWPEGRDRCMTPAAWTRWARTADAPRRRAPVVKLEPKVRTVADDVLNELGARRAG